LALSSVAASPANGSPVFKIRGQLQARVATHNSADPGSLMVRVGFDDRAELLAAAQPLPTFITGHYLNWTAVLVGKDIFLLSTG